MKYVHVFFRVAGASLALAIILNALGDLVLDGFGVDFLWIRFPPGLAACGRLVLLAAAAGMLYAAARPVRDRRLVVAIEVALGLVALAALGNAISFYAMLARGEIGSRLPVPSSVAVAAVLAATMARIRTEHVAGSRADATDSPRRAVTSHLVAFAAVGLVGPLTFLVAYGTTDYVPHERRADARADCIIVYGAGVYADGTPSESLANRVREGARLYRDGAAPYVVMYGGFSRLGISEPEVMKRLAIELGVAESAIVTDAEGVNTYQTVLRAKTLMSSRAWTRSISVSHYYHLLRIQLVSTRLGLETLTVPATRTRRLRLEPYYVLRECCALYWYYLTKW